MGHCSSLPSLQSQLPSHRCGPYRTDPTLTRLRQHSLRPKTYMEAPLANSIGTHTGTPSITLGRFTTSRKGWPV